MLESVTDLAGDSFKDRWERFEQRARDCCRKEGLPDPTRRLKSVRPWFEWIGMWYDLYGPPIRAYVVLGRNENPVLRLVREVDQLLCEYDDHQLEAGIWSSGPYHYPITTIRSASRHLLSVVRNAPPRPASSVQEDAVTALSEYLQEGGRLLERQRFRDIKPHLKARAQPPARDKDQVWEVAAEDAVVLAIRREGEEKVQTDPPPDWVGLDVIKRVELERLLLEDLIPGTDEHRLRGSVSYFLTDDFLGGSDDGRSKTETRDDRVSQEVVEPEVLSERKGMRQWSDRDTVSPGEFCNRLARELTDEEREMLSRLRENGGNVSGAARELGWTRYRGRKVYDAIEEKAKTAARRGVPPAINKDFSLH